MRRWRMPAVLAGGLVVAGAFGLARDESKSQGSKPKHPANRLARETSPYLLQHAHNPVDWYPWGPEAFAKAKEAGKPIFLSVGYSACYWCHVMERESFMDEAIARVLNRRFICIKVDREERPDVDQIYMAAVQLFSDGHGGWPMSVFLFPDGRPFFAGTYFPPKDREGHEGFLSLLDRVDRAWREHRAELDRDATKVAELIRRATGRTAGSRVPLSRAMASGGMAQLAEQFDSDHGGFGFDPANPRRPKFPEPANLIFLLDQHRRAGGKGLIARGGPGRGPEPLEMVVTTLDRMARGGIRDHLAGGYHRYSVDRFWRVPHFEKMLYDNAQLATAHLLAFEATGDPRWRREAEATLAFVARSLTTPEGAFASALDAETEGDEGGYYAWTREEVERVLGAREESRAFARVYGLDRAPNFEGDRFVLYEPLPLAEQARALGTTPEALDARLAPLRAKLLAARERRPAPRRDDKVLTAWNGLMIAAFADAGRLLKVPAYRRAAERAADFLLARLRTPDGRLLRTYRAGQAKLPAYLEDYAFLAHGLLRLHAATGDPQRLAQAKALTDRMIADFADEQAGGFFFTAADHESLLARPKDPSDNALPGGNSVAIGNLVALAAAAGEARYLDLAGRALDAFSPGLSRAPAGAPWMLMALQDYLDARPAAGRVADEPAAADPLGLPARVVTVAATTIPRAAVAPGREFAVELTLTIKEGWHLYANPTGSPTLKPTVITLAPGSPMALVRVDYPTGTARRLASVPEEIALYEGKVTMTAHVRPEPGAEPGPSKLEFRVRYQACDDRACLAPATLSVPIEVTIGGG